MSFFTTNFSKFDVLFVVKSEQNFTGPLELILDRTVIPMLDRIAGMKFLKENGVGPVRMLDPNQLEIKSDFDKVRVNAKFFCEFSRRCGLRGEC